MTTFHGYLAVKFLHKFVQLMAMPTKRSIQHIARYNRSKVIVAIIFMMLCKQNKFANMKFYAHTGPSTVHIIIKITKIMFITHTV